MKALTIIPLLIATTVSADDIWVNVHFGSVHDSSSVTDDNGNQYDINNFNPGIGIEFPVYDYGKPNKNQSYRLGVFNNSYSKLSAYAGLDFHTEYTPGLGTGITFGIVTGYKDSPIDSDVFIGIVPRIHYVFGRRYKAETSFIYGQYASAISFTLGVAY